jgi:hypothetical protein
MKLDTKTINVLKNFSSVNPSMLFKEGNVVATISPNKTIMARATVPAKFSNKFAIYNLGRFLSTLSLFEDPDLSFTDRYVKISDSTGRSVNYTFADETTIKTPPEKEIKLPSVDVTFQLTNANLTDILKALGVLSLPEFAVVGDGSNVSLQAMDSKNPSGDVYSIDVGKTDKNFRAIFKVENIKVIPGDYTVNLSSKGISHFESPEAEYWIAIEATSTF